VRRPIVAANWKMNATLAEATELAGEVQRLTAGATDVDIVVCPPFTALAAVANLLQGSPLAVGAQNVHWETSGAYTGEISLPMLQDLGCAFVILGHSERRALFGETDANVNRKARAAMDAGLTPIVCVGESLEQRESGRTEEVVERQIEQSLEGFGVALSRVVVAYEPVWAIGTGRTATPEQAQQVHAFIRDRLTSEAGSEVAQGIRLQYGGSVKPGNAAELFGQSDVDGGLIGGAALDAGSFAEIVRAARRLPEV